MEHQPHRKGIFARFRRDAPFSPGGDLPLAAKRFGLNAVARLSMIGRENVRLPWIWRSNRIVIYSLPEVKPSFSRNNLPPTDNELGVHVRQFDMEYRNESRPLVTSTNLAPVIQAITWVLLAAIFLAVALRLLTRFYLQRRLKYDDLFVVIAFVRRPRRVTFLGSSTTTADDMANGQLFSVGQSITLFVPAGSVWGRSLRAQQQVSDWWPEVKPAQQNITFQLAEADMARPYRLNMPASCFSSRAFASPSSRSRWACLPSPL